MRKTISKNNLLKLRLSKNLTYRQLADEINSSYENAIVSSASLNRWETQARCEVSMTKIAALAKYFNVSINELLLESTIEDNLDIDPKDIPLDSIRVEILRKVLNASEEELILVADFLNKL